MRGRRAGGPSGSSRNTNSIDPINIIELLRTQEQSLLKDLPEEERKKYEDESRMYRSTGGKGLLPEFRGGVCVYFSD